MKTTLLIVGACNLIIACTTTHPNTLDLNLNLTKPINITENKTSRQSCDLSQFLDTMPMTVNKNPYKATKDIRGYVEALEENQSQIVESHVSLLKAVLKCHSR